MERDIAILADDLTGALDAAAAFATPANPVATFWADGETVGGGDFAIDSETRGLPEDAAAHAVARLIPRLSDHRISYKKIDSLLRGNTLAEIATCAHSDVFGAVLVAPAFPARERITRNGRQYAKVDGEWQQVGPAIGDVLQVRSVQFRRIDRSAHPSGAGVFVCDAESDDDLVEIAMAAPALAPPILWCGSAGLAHALAGLSHDRIVLPRVHSILALIGSRHGASRAQARCLAAAMPHVVVELTSPSDAEATVAAIAARLAAHGQAALVLGMPQLSAAEADAVLAEICTQLVEAVKQPDLAIVAGGDTLLKLAVSLRVTRIETVGDWQPGMPVSRFPNGLWRGTGILSKSGAFGSATTLVDAFASVAGEAI